MTDWTKTLDESVFHAEHIIRDHRLMLVSEARARELSELAGGDLTREEATAWDYLLEFDPGDRVEGGEGDDHDTGRIESVEGAVAIVAWDSGVKTPACLRSLRRVD